VINSGKIYFDYCFYLFTN